MSSAPITVILSRDLSRETQGKCQSRDRGEAPRHATCVQELPTRFYPPMMIWWYPKVTFLHFKRRVLWPDESMTNPLKSRQFQTHFKTIKRCFQEFKMDQFKDGPCHRVRRISPLEDDAILIRFWKRRTILQETGPLTVCEGSARLKKAPFLSFYLKIVGTTI